MMKNVLCLGFVMIALSGCLKTRNDVKDSDQREVMQQQTATLQKENADANSRIGDVQEQLRDLNGRVDVVEHKQTTSSTSLENNLKNSQQQNQELSQKVAIMQEALTKMEAQVFQLNADVQAQRAEKAAAVAQAAVQQSKRDPYEAGQEYFTQKDWKKAILNYQKSRDESPKGPHYPEATYKIGVCFQELGMKDEAKTFYDEAINKFPKSEQAKKSKTRLKSLKK